MFLENFCQKTFSFSKHIPKVGHGNFPWQLSVYLQLTNVLATFGEVARATFLATFDVCVFFPGAFFFGSNQMVRMKRPAAVLDAEHAKPRNAEESLPGEGTPKAPVPVVKMEPGQFPPIPKRDAQNMHKKLAKQKKAGRTDLAEKHQKCHSQQEKREFFYTTYSLDPEVSKKAVTKSDLDSESTVTKSTTGWFTKDQVAQDKGVLPSNPRYSELLDASVAGLKERPHEDPTLLLWR